jgi:hypothetical protein
MQTQDTCPLFIASDLRPRSANAYLGHDEFTGKGVPLQSASSPGNLTWTVLIFVAL